jgi:hypothetical protein
VKFISSRDIVVRSKLIGAAILFKKGVPTLCPAGMYDEVLEKGVLPVEEDGTPINPATTEVIQEDKKKVMAPDDPAARTRKIADVLRDIVQRNNPHDFTAAGTPNATAVTAGLGWKVDQKEVRTVWEKHRAALTGSQLAA